MLYSTHNTFIRVKVMKFAHKLTKTYILLRSLNWLNWIDKNSIQKSNLNCIVIS